jgi:hypothetical protein
MACCKPSDGNVQAHPKLEDRVQTRMARQSILTRDTHPHLALVLDEATLRRPIGGPEVMREQLSHLLDIVTHSTSIQLRALPFDRANWASTDGSFTLLSFVDGPEVAYFEGTGAGVVLRGLDQVTEAALRFDLVLGEALPQAETRDLIARALEDYA